ncbi:class I SAM-dependent methyltransferase [Saccharopolyspora hattusasensis]|uniref:class I SAM-dependent methyltransferase n=1 Tax=Saccharopolyspora hattusasensis TaxID=1128679 RepID=UPI003D95B2FA
MRNIDSVPPSVGRFGPATNFFQAARLIAESGQLAYRPALFDQLLSDVWFEGRVYPATVDAAEHLSTMLPAVAPAWRPWLALALGVFAEGHAPDPALSDAVYAAVAKGYDGYRELLSRLGSTENAARTSLLYLLAHFPAQGDLIEGLTRSPHVSAPDAARVARCTEDPAAESRFPLGRCWPSPTHWVLDTHEKQIDQEWRASLALPDEDHREIRDLETMAILALLGAQAEDAADRESADLPGARQTPAELLQDTRERLDVREPAPGTQNTATSAAVPHHQHDVFCCPDCLNPLDLAVPSECPRCGKGYDIADTVVDFLPGTEFSQAGLGLMFLKDPLHVARYESHRLSFVALMAADWAGEITFEDEYAYLRDHIRPVDGPVLDVACGSGRWTRPLADIVGADRVVGVDVSRAMVDQFHAALPGIPIGRASVTSLPIASGSVGAVNCWNALQLFANPWAALSEMARVLRPGGSLTLLTFRTTARPLQRHFQRRHETAFNVSSFDRDVLTSRIREMGFEIIDSWSPNNYLFVTARRLTSDTSDGQTKAEI